MPPSNQHIDGLVIDHVVVAAEHAPRQRFVGFKRRVHRRFSRHFAGEAVAAQIFRMFRIYLVRVERAVFARGRRTVAAVQRGTRRVLRRKQRQAAVRRDRKAPTSAQRAQNVQIVTALGEDHRPARLRFGPRPAHVAVRRPPVRHVLRLPYAHHAADRALVDEPLDLAIKETVPEHMAHHDRAAGLRRQRGERPAVGLGAGNGLFDEHVVAGFKRRARLGEVIPVGRGDDDRIGDLSAREKFVRAPVQPVGGIENTDAAKSRALLLVSATAAMSARPDLRSRSAY